LFVCRRCRKYWTTLLMSSDLTMFTGNVFNSSAAAASGPPGDDLSYAEAFPPLPTAVSVGNGADPVLPASPTTSGRNQWGKKMSLRLSTTTQVFISIHFSGNSLKLLPSDVIFYA